jgi:hypothetical protein
MTIHPLTPHQPRPLLRPGQPVHVNAHAAWLPATVATVTHARIGIRVPTAAGTLARTVAPWVVHPADGHRLAAVDQLRHGDEVAAADGRVHTVVGVPWQGRDGWWVLTYGSGETAALPPAAVLRLVDATPAVTINGRPVSQR